MLFVCTVQRSRSVTHISTLFKGFPDSSVGKESAHNAGDPGSIPGLGRSAAGGMGYPRLPTPVFLGFPCGTAGKESPCNVGDLGSIPGLGQSPGSHHVKSQLPSWTITTVF